jgi:hypothetical protein
MAEPNSYPSRRPRNSELTVSREEFVALAHFLISHSRSFTSCIARRIMRRMNPHSSARDPPRPHSRTASVKASVGGLCLLAFVCTAANGSARITTADGPGRATAVAGGYGLFPSPARLATQCRRAQRHVRFTVLCPTVMPRSGDGVTAATASPLPPGDAGVEPTTFAQWAGYPANVTARSLYVGGIYGGGETDPPTGR